MRAGSPPFPAPLWYPPHWITGYSPRGWSGRRTPTEYSSGQAREQTARRHEGPREVPPPDPPWPTPSVLSSRARLAGRVPPRLDLPVQDAADHVQAPAGHPGARTGLKGPRPGPCGHGECARPPRQGQETPTIRVAEHRKCMTCPEERVGDAVVDPSSNTATCRCASNTVQERKSFSRPSIRSASWCQPRPSSIRPSSNATAPKDQAAMARIAPSGASRRMSRSGVSGGSVLTPRR